MKGFFLAVALVLASGFIAVPSFAHGDGDHQYTTLASAVMNGVENDENRDALKNFVMHAKAHIEEAVLIEDFLILLGEFRDEEGDWMAHERSIYLYIFTAGETEDGEHEEIAVFNAVNPAVEGFNLHGVTDANGVEIAHELIDTATDPEGDGFGEYTWDDPRIPGDEVNEPGKSPGISDKVSYTVKVKLPGGEQSTSTEFVLGSGFYPTPLPLMDDSDDGCAIAGGTAGRDGISPLFNLFLVVSALFLAVSWKTRTVRR